MAVLSKLSWVDTQTYQKHEENQTDLAQCIQVLQASQWEQRCHDAWCHQSEQGRAQHDASKHFSYDLGLANSMEYRAEYSCRKHNDCELYNQTRYLRHQRRPRANLVRTARKLIEVQSRHPCRCKAPARVTGVGFASRLALTEYPPFGSQRSAIAGAEARVAAFKALPRTSPKATLVKMGCS